MYIYIYQHHGSHGPHGIHTAVVPRRSSQDLNRGRDHPTAYDTVQTCPNHGINMVAPNTQTVRWGGTLGWSYMIILYYIPIYIQIFDIIYYIHFFILPPLVAIFFYHGWEQPWSILKSCTGARRCPQRLLRQQMPDLTSARSWGWWDVSKLKKGSGKSTVGRFYNMGMDQRINTY